VGHEVFNVWETQTGSKLLSGFTFLGHGNPDNKLESLCIEPCSKLNLNRRLEGTCHLHIQR
jgi:hypothetical protein